LLGICTQVPTHKQQSIVFAPQKYKFGLGYLGTCGVLKRKKTFFYLKESTSTRASTRLKIVILYCKNHILVFKGGYLYGFLYISVSKGSSKQANPVFSLAQSHLTQGKIQQPACQRHFCACSAKASAEFWRCIVMS